MANRTRKENNLRNTTSKDGSFSPHISHQTAERIRKYCKLTNQNKTKFVEQCCNERLDVLEVEQLQKLSKEELIKLIIKN